MTAFYTPAASVPFSALPQIAAGSIVGNNTGSTATASAISGYVPSTTVTATGTISYTGIKTSIIVNSASATNQTLATSPVVGSLVDVKNIGAGIATILPPAGGSINGQTSFDLPAASGGIQANLTLRCESSTTFSII